MDNPFAHLLPKEADSNNNTTASPNPFAHLLPASEQNKFQLTEEGDPVNTFDANVKGTINVLEWARKKNCPVIYAGSSSNHGDKFSNPYTFSKWQGEELCRLYSKLYDLPTSIC